MNYGPQQSYAPRRLPRAALCVSRYSSQFLLNFAQFLMLPHSLSGVYDNVSSFPSLLHYLSIKEHTPRALHLHTRMHYILAHAHGAHIH